MSLLLGDTQIKSMSQPSVSQSNPILSASGVSLRFGSAPPVVAGFDLHVQQGEILTMLGPSGVGKSSLLRVFAGLQRASAGQILLHQKSLEEPNPLVALAFQHPALLPWLTVRENVAFGLDFKSQAAVPRAVQNKRIEDALAEVGLSDAASKYPDQISGGMAQRAALARCLAREPVVLLLDEPFGALDEVTRRAMQTLLLEARQRHNMAVVLVTHDIDEALLVSDRIGLLAGNPARLSQTWQLGRAHSQEPRDLLDDQFVTLRVDILKALRAGMTGRCLRDLATSNLNLSTSTATNYAKEYAHVL